MYEEVYYYTVTGSLMRPTIKGILFVLSQMARMNGLSTIFSTGSLAEKKFTSAMVAAAASVPFSSTLRNISCRILPTEKSCLPVAIFVNFESAETKVHYLCHSTCTAIG